MRRREFIGLIGATALGLPQRGHAELRPGVPVVGLLTPASPDLAKSRVDALRDGMRTGGFVEGVNYSLASRYASGEMDRLPALAGELAALKPSVIVAAANAARIVRKLFPEIPMVFTSFAADPIAAGLAESYARPGGTATGNTMNAIGGEAALTEKRIGYFKELVPDMTRLGVIGWRGALNYADELAGLKNVAVKFGFELQDLAVQTLDELDEAFAAGQRDKVSAFYIAGDPLMLSNLSRVMDFVRATGKPSLGAYPEWGRAGLLMSYATDIKEGFRLAGVSVTKILKGTKPGDLPIEQASKFSLVVNQKTAKALGITVPANLLALADEVVE